MGRGKEVNAMARVQTEQPDYGAFGGWLVGAILLAGLVWWIVSTM